MKKFLIGAFLLMGAVAGPAWAEENDTLRVVDVDEVNIIATPKENRRLRELPSAVTLLSQQTLQAAQVQGVKQLSGVVPGVFIPDYGSRLTSAVYIRSIGSRTGTPSVGLYVDNIPYVDKSAFDFSYADVERIDVLRGPQGTLYGRNTMGGLIKVYTKSPFSYQGTDVRLGAATHGYANVSLTHYHRPSERFAFSAGGFYDYEGGMFRNTALNNTKVDRGERLGGRLRGIWFLTDNWKLDMNVNYEYNDQDGYPYYYTGAVNPDKQTEEMRPYIGRIAYNRTSGYRRNLLNAGVNAQYQGTHFTLSAVTGYQWLSDRMFLDQDFTPQDIYTLEQRQRINTLSEEVVLKSRPDRRWTWTTGAFGFYQWLNTEAPVTFCLDGMAMLGGKLGSAIPSSIPVQMGQMTMNILPSLGIDSSMMPIDGTFDTPLIGAAIFHQSTFHHLLGVQGLSFTAGLRLDYERMQLSYNSGTSMDYHVAIRGEMKQGEITIREIEMMPETPLTVSSRYEGDLNKDYLQLLPKFSLQYDFRKGRGNVYVTVSKGYRSGGYNIQGFSELLQSSLRSDMMDQTRETILNAAPEQYKALLEKHIPAGGERPDVRTNVEYKPEQTWSYEAGAHVNLWEQRLQLDAALFWMDTRDQQLSRFVSSGLGRETVNAGKSRSRGMELSVTLLPTDALRLTAAYGYTYATFRNYRMGDAASDADAYVDYTGHYVPFVPKHTLNVGGQYTFDLRGRRWLDSVTLAANYNGAGRIYWTEENTVSQAFYGTLNGRLALCKGAVEVAFWARNVLDKEYASFYFESMDNGFMQKGRPVQAGVELRCRF